MNKFYVKGITFFELIICLSIIAIAVNLGLPHLHNLLARQESAKIKQIITQNFHFAKAQASMLRSRIVICASLNGLQCHSDEWNTGFIVFNDLNENNQVNNNEQIYVHQELALQYGSLVWRGALARSNVFFNAEQGLPNGSNGSFYYCSTRSQPHHRIILSNMGHARSETSDSC